MSTKNKKNDLEAELLEDVTKRIEIIESSSYDPGPKINKNDVFIMIAIGIICIIGLIWGAN